MAQILQGAGGTPVLNDDMLEKMRASGGAYALEGDVLEGEDPRIIQAGSIGNATIPMAQYVTGTGPEIDLGYTYEPYIPEDKIADLMAEQEGEGSSDDSDDYSDLVTPSGTPMPGHPDYAAWMTAGGEGAPDTQASDGLSSSYTSIGDMFDGGGAGSSGNTFKGGTYSGALNALGVTPYGWNQPTYTGSPNTFQSLEESGALDMFSDDQGNISIPNTGPPGGGMDVSGSGSSSSGSSAAPDMGPPEGWNTGGQIKGYVNGGRIGNWWNRFAGDADYWKEKDKGQKAKWKESLETGEPMYSGREMGAFLPVVGDAIAAEEVYKEMKKPNPNWLLIGALGGATIIGAIPGIGDAAAALIKKGAKAGLEGIGQAGNLARAKIASKIESKQALEATSPGGPLDPFRNVSSKPDLDYEYSVGKAEVNDPDAWLYDYDPSDVKRIKDDIADYKARHKDWTPEDITELEAMWHTALSPEDNPFYYKNNGGQIKGYVNGGHVYGEIEEEDPRRNPYAIAPLAKPAKVVDLGGPLRTGDPTHEKESPWYQDVGLEVGSGVIGNALLGGAKFAGTTLGFPGWITGLFGANNGGEVKGYNGGGPIQGVGPIGFNPPIGKGGHYKTWKEEIAWKQAEAKIKLDKEKAAAKIDLDKKKAMADLKIKIDDKKIPNYGSYRDSTDSVLGDPNIPGLHQDYFKQVHRPNMPAFDKAYNMQANAYEYPNTKKSLGAETISSGKSFIRTPVSYDPMFANYRSFPESAFNSAQEQRNRQFNEDRKAIQEKYHGDTIGMLTGIQNLELAVVEMVYFLELNSIHYLQSMLMI